VDERFITLDDEALGKRMYHEQHFFCAECGDPFLPPSSGSGGLTVTGDGEFDLDDDVGFTVYKGHPYCEACHVRLRMPKCKRCKKSIRDGMRAGWEMVLGVFRMRGRHFSSFGVVFEAELTRIMSCL
jgi:hypothetical protein